jgi:hypothetical protein
MEHLCAMKKLIFLFVLLAASQATLAAELSVVAKAENGLFHIKYTDERTCNTRMVIKDAEGNRIFSEVIRNQCSFIRPYNFTQMPYGRYTVIATNEFGEKVTYVEHQPKPEVDVRYNVFRRSDGKYLLLIPKSAVSQIHVSISNGEELLYFKNVKLNGDFACIYDIKNLPDSASVEFQVRAIQ